MTIGYAPLSLLHEDPPCVQLARDFGSDIREYVGRCGAGDLKEPRFCKVNVVREDKTGMLACLDVMIGLATMTFPRRTCRACPCGTRLHGKVLSGGTYTAPSGSWQCLIMLVLRIATRFGAITKTIRCSKYVEVQMMFLPFPLPLNIHVNSEYNPRCTAWL